MNVREALRQIPRASFIPDTIGVRGHDRWMVPLRREENPDEWARLVVLDDEAIVTQVDGGLLRKGFGQPVPAAPPRS